eukprot:gb/GFBE01021667.1/.p1 GENE.gb/GFBE01021667.1/~~gb/GFBE01021667.1/.p1  ORF type:complete len:462 (+),score=96.80 gb/GFBE01021667.1/:1-1386(+)
MNSLVHLEHIGLPIVQAHVAQLPQDLQWHDARSSAADLEARGLEPFAFRLMLRSARDFGATVHKSPEGVVLISGGGLKDFVLEGRSSTASGTSEVTVLESIKRTAFDLRHNVRPPRTREAELLEDVGKIFSREEVVIELRDVDGGYIQVDDGKSSLQVAVPSPLLPHFDLDGIAKYMLQGVRNVIVMCGAGISTSAGIPDFRSSDGLYATLFAQYPSLKRPEDMFSLSYFRQNPWPFYDRCREMWPGKFRPTPCHHFLKLLQDKGVLLRCYSQNIDSMEAMAGVMQDKLVLAHGTFDRAHVVCPEAGAARESVEVPVDEMKRAVQGGKDRLLALREKYGGFCKPRIVMFGEALPDRFLQCKDEDFQRCDLLLVMGTSLKVPPFCNLLSEVPLHVPRLLINRDMVGEEGPEGPPGGFRFGEKKRYRDVFQGGNIDTACLDLADLLGWTTELHELMAKYSHPA